MNDFIRVGCVDFVKYLMVFLDILQRVASDIFLVIYKDSLSIWWLDIGFNGFEEFIIDESVVDVSLQVVGLIADNLVGVCEKSDFPFIESQELLISW